MATAESLTGGLLVARLIDVPGASAVVQGGACTYSFESKASVLGLDLDNLRAHGAVRASVAGEMARGAQRVYGANIALATTGVAGPGPDPFGVAEGTAFVACAINSEVTVRELCLTGSREAIRRAVVEQALAMGIASLEA